MTIHTILLRMGEVEEGMGMGREMGKKCVHNDNKAMEEGEDGEEEVLLT